MTDDARRYDLSRDHRVYVRLRVSSAGVRYDADNVIKPLLDAITETGAVWGDDSQVWRLEVIKENAGCRRFMIWVRVLNEEGR